MRWNSSSSVHAEPSGFQDVYGVSQNQHRRLQPEVRIKRERVPAHGPSPWIDSKISAICMVKNCRGLAVGDGMVTTVPCDADGSKWIIWRKGQDVSRRMSGIRVP